MNNFLLEFKNLYAGYGTRPVLENIHLGFVKPQFIAIAGPNGSGKTSLVNAVFGADNIKIFQGEICINVNKNELSAVPQISSPVFNFRVPDFIELGIPKVCSALNYDEIIQALELENLLPKSIQELSAGEYQRVLIAQSLVKKPKIVFLDEPLSHLDLKYQFKILEFLKNLSKDVLVICIIHNLEFVVNFDFFDECIFLKNGLVFKNTANLTDTIKSVFEIPYITL